MYVLFLDSLDVFSVSVAYITEEGKTKVNLFFKSAEYIHVTKIRIKVSSSIMGGHSGFYIVVGAVSWIYWYKLKTTMAVSIGPNYLITNTEINNSYCRPSVKSV